MRFMEKVEAARTAWLFRLLSLVEDNKYFVSRLRLVSKSKI